MMTCVMPAKHLGVKSLPSGEAGSEWGLRVAHGERMAGGANTDKRLAGREMRANGIELLG